MSSVYHTIGRNIGLALSRHAVQPTSIVGIVIVVEGIFFVAVVKNIFFVVLVVVVLLFTE